MRYGPYEVLGELGRGGMGAVLRARHVETGAEVALKVLLDARGPEDLERFAREGQALARLRHPAVVPVHAAGVEGGRAWLAMDLVAGESLRARLARDGPLDGPTARRLFTRLAAALEHAHRHGVVHRDLKPDNVVIDPLGEPRLIDFGLARVTDRTRLTRSGDLLGTPAYMAPEQVTGDVARQGPCTDVYGLGATLYEALTGRPPFEGGSPVAILDGVLRRAPPALASVRPGVDPALARLCLACLEKDPARRPPSVAHVRRALAPAPVGGPGPGRRGGARPPAAGGAAAAALMAGPPPTTPPPSATPPIDDPVAAPIAPPIDDPVAALDARADALAAAGDLPGAVAALGEALAAAPARADRGAACSVTRRATCRARGRTSARRRTGRRRSKGSSPGRACAAGATSPGPRPTCAPP
ncbi:MAG: serine/threonine protein kinase [Planctomycetes bacterium]|nr:serine/threonine protein kinase [Planctomycetota bacterium]